MERKKEQEKEREEDGEGLKKAMGEMQKKHEMSWVIKSKTLKLSTSPRKNIVKSSSSE